MGTQNLGCSKSQHDYNPQLKYDQHLEYGMLSSIAEEKFKKFKEIKLNLLFMGLLFNNVL